MEGMSLAQARKILSSSPKTVELEVLPMLRSSKDRSSSQGSVSDHHITTKQQSGSSSPSERQRLGIRGYLSKPLFGSNNKFNSLDRVVSSHTTSPGMSPYRTMTLRRNYLTSKRRGSTDDSRSFLSTTSNTSSMSFSKFGHVFTKIELIEITLKNEKGEYGLEVEDCLSNIEAGCIVIASLTSGKSAER